MNRLLNFEVRTNGGVGTSPRWKEVGKGAVSMVKPITLESLTPKHFGGADGSHTNLGVNPRHRVRIVWPFVYLIWTISEKVNSIECWPLPLVSTRGAMPGEPRWEEEGFDSLGRGSDVERVAMPDVLGRGACNGSPTSAARNPSQKQVQHEI